MHFCELYRTFIHQIRRQITRHTIISILSQTLNLWVSRYTLLIRLIKSINDIYRGCRRQKALTNFMISSSNALEKKL